MGQHLSTKKHRHATRPRFSGKFKARAPRQHIDTDPWSRAFDEREVPDGWVPKY